MARSAVGSQPSRSNVSPSQRLLRRGARSHSGCKVSVLECLLTVALCCVTAVVSAQTGSQTEPGIQPYETYDGARENFNLATSNLNLSIPLVKLAGRAGFDYYVNLTYNTGPWSVQGGRWAGSSSWVLEHPGNVSFYAAGTTTPAQNVQCKSPYVFTKEDGTVLSFSLVSDCVFTVPPYTEQPQYEQRVASDSRQTGYTADLNQCRLTYKDGTFYPLQANSCPYNGATIGVIEDRNGNQITGYGGTDTLGRAVTVTTNSVQYKDSNGATRTVSINYQQVTLACTLAATGGALQPAGTLNLPSSVVLPDGLTYIFQYDGCGELVKITYPSGGYTRYDWDYQHYFHTSNQRVTYVEMVAKHVCRAPAVAFGATSTGTGNTCPGPFTEDTTTYAPTISGSNYNNSAVSVTDQLGNLTTHQFKQSVAGSTPPVETSRSIYQGSSTLLRTVNTTYTTTFPIEPTKEVTILGNGLQSKIVWTPTSDLPTKKQEYAFGQGAPGALTRTTNYTWCDTQKASETVYNGSGTQIAQTTYEMDNYTAGLSASGAVQHDSAFGTSQTSGRCNVTAVKVWRNTDGATLTTRMQYDDAGNVLSKTAPSNTPYDSLTRTTTYSYADVWGNSACTPSGGNAAAYPTNVTDAAGHVTKSSYNTCTGTAASTTDPNNQTTTFSYDLMDRLTQTNLPDTGQTSSCFSEVSGTSCSTGAYPLQVQTTQLISSGLNKVSTAVLDGLARVSETQLNSDPDCTASGGTKVDTTYDGAEHTFTVSNPYCTTSDTTYGITTYQYDGMGRVTKVIPPDGSSTSNNVATSYDVVLSSTPPANCSTVTDQALKSRKSCSDSMGRMTQVFEDPSGLNYETDYSYDALNNLLSVTQQGGSSSGNWRNRSFVYDSLSQLTGATNPESGTITYGYDNNGNLMAKTSPAPNQTNPGVTQVISYCYDAVNRETSKAYAQLSCPMTSPPVSYFYDQTSFNGLTIANGTGRRTGLSDGSGATAWSYDLMGRTAALRRLINGIGNTATYAYSPYVNGEFGNLTYFSGSQVAYTWSGADRPLSAIDPYPINFVKNATYAPTGALAGAAFGAYNGGFPGTTVSNQYNNRLQPAVLSATSPTMTVFSLSYSFNQGTQQSPINNGSVVTIQNNRDTTRTQAFTYDSLNRILSAQTPNSSLWGDTFVIDAWGNLTNKNMISGKTGGENLQMSALTNNQLVGMTYDAAGNVTNDGMSHSYVYDAENRLISAGGMSYIYDGDGNRVEKCTAGTQAGTCASGATGTLYWRGKDGETLNESDLGTSTWKRFVFFNGQMVARRDASTGNVYYFYSDHLGSMGVVTDSLGQTIENESDYYPYGGERVVTSALSDEPYKFTGKERDTESTLDFFGARHYSSVLGRFIGADYSDFFPFPVPSADFGDPQSLNLYAYTDNNPSTNADPDGHDCVVQTRTSSTTEDVSVSSGNCDNVEIGDGQTKTYIAGTVDLDSVKSDNAGGITFGYTPYSGGSGVADLGDAPIPSNTSLAYNWGDNAAGYQLLGTASRAMTNVTYGYAALYGVGAGAVVGSELAASTAAARSGIIFRLAHGMRLAAGHSQILAEQNAVKNAIATAIASGAIQKMGTAFEGVVNVAGTYIKFTGALNPAGQVVVSNVMGAALQK